VRRFSAFHEHRDGGIDVEHVKVISVGQRVKGIGKSICHGMDEWMGAKRVVCLRQFPGLRAGCAAQGRNLQKQGANQLHCQTLMPLRS